MVVKASRAVEVLQSPTLREEVHRTVLPGGLQVYFCPKRGFKKRYASYAIHYGSVDSVFVAPGEAEPRQVPEGIAHFLEHTLFETPRGNVSELFAQNGAYSNAATSFNTTVYLFSAAERFYENLELLLWFVETPHFDPVKVEKEKGIIEQEIRMYRDDPGWVVYMGLLESLFARHPIRIDIAGSPESIREIDVEALNRCYRTFYSSPNMILFVIGDLERDELFDFVAGRSRGGQGALSGASPLRHDALPPRHDASPPRHGALPPRPPRGGAGGGAGGGARGGPTALAPVIRRIYPGEPPEPGRPRFEKEMEVALPKLLMGFKEVEIPAAGREFLRSELLTELVLDILFGRGSEGFQRLYERQLILDDFGASFHAVTGVGYTAIGGETPRPEELKGAILEEIARAREARIPPEDFHRQKRKFVGSFIRHFNSLEYIASNYTYFRFHDVDLFDAIDALEGIRREEVEDRLRTLFDPARSAVSLVLPKRP